MFCQFGSFFSSFSGTARNLKINLFEVEVMLLCFALSLLLQCQSPKTYTQTKFFNVKMCIMGIKSFIIFDFSPGDLSIN